MTKIAVFAAALLLVGCVSTSRNGNPSAQEEPLLAVTGNVEQYATGTVQPLLAAVPSQNTLARLLLVSRTLTDPHDGVSINRIPPSKFMTYNILSKVGLGTLSMIGLSPVQKETLRRWQRNYMQADPADVFFAPSADEVIRTRGAFGCTHYARAFIAVVKALGLVRGPQDLRYVISSKANDYNQALADHDFRATINGHQFVIIRIDSRWIAINTSRGESTPLPAGFDPDSCLPPHNIPIRFPAYPDVVFLLRKIGTDWDDGCGDGSRAALMNISRSGAPDNPDFQWEPFAFEKLDAFHNDTNSTTAGCQQAVVPDADSRASATASVW